MININEHPGYKKQKNISAYLALEFWTSVAQMLSFAAATVNII